jgi:hypothetical protein
VADFHTIAALKGTTNIYIYTSAFCQDDPLKAVLQSWRYEVNCTIYTNDVNVVYTNVNEDEKVKVGSKDRR